MPETGISGAIPSALMAQAARNSHDKVALRYGEQSFSARRRSCRRAASMRTTSQC
jgi:hypothetical protein